MINVTFCIPRSVRVKLNSQCQYNCKFCHQEGNAKAEGVSPNELIKALNFLKNNLFFYRVHFTGGEPTLYDDFSKLIKKLKKAGFISAVTSNGQFEGKMLKTLKRNGLSSINFSLHSLDPKSFLKLQNKDFKLDEGLKWSSSCIKRTVNNILTANELIKTKVNCVVSKDLASVKDVLEFCRKNKISLRLLNDLGIGKVATDNIQKLLLSLNAKLFGHEITFLSSSHRLDYSTDSYIFGVKCIRPFYLNSLCKKCKLRKNNKCLEGFYGIRLEDNPLMVRLCLNRNGYPYVQKFQSFVKSKQFIEIKETTLDVVKYLKKDSFLKEQKERFKS